MSDRITAVVPRPRRVAFAGGVFDVWPATLNDLADLQAWLDSSWPDPLVEIWPQLHGDDALEGEPRWALLRRSLEEAEIGPPAWDDDRGQDLLLTAEGVAVLVYLALRKGHPKVDAESAAKLSSVLTPAEYFAVRRTWLGCDPVPEIGRLLLDGFPLKTRGVPPTWGKAIHETAEAYGWTYPQVYEMTLAEFANARRGGSPAIGPELDCLPDNRDMMARHRERVSGPPESGPDASPPS